MSYNSTGLDKAKTSWIRNLSETLKIDFFQIQEHFKIAKSLDNFFKKEFPTNDSFIVPGHREPFQDTGRAKGGLAQLACKNLQVKKERIIVNNWRIQAQILYFGGHKLMWINCYFPTDPQTVQFDDNELIAAQNDIENILDNNVFDDCIVGGDFNFDSSRSSGFSNCMKEFLSRLGLVSVWSKFHADFTHLHVDSKSTSVIDHFFLNQGLLDLVEDAGPIHLGDNLSRHSPIMLKLKLPQVAYSNTKETEFKMNRSPAWYKASQADNDHYTSLLEQKLLELEIPTNLRCSDIHCEDRQHIHDGDLHVLDILCTVIETSYETIPLTSSKGTRKNFHQPLPGWNELVKPVKQDSLFWHSVWLSAMGDPPLVVYTKSCATQEGGTM